MSEKQNTERPGFLIFFETLDALREYNEAETGLFIRSMGDFARYGVIPEFEDRGLRGLWRLVQPILSRDNASYYERCRKNRYNSYLSSVKRRFQREYPGKEPIEGKDFLSYEDWCSQVDEAVASDGKRSDATACDRYPIGSQLNVTERNSTESERNGTEQNTKLNGNLSGNANERGVQGGTSLEVLGAWREAMGVHDLQTASELSAQLSRMGYITDPQTLEMRKRDP